MPAERLGRGSDAAPSVHTRVVYRDAMTLSFDRYCSEIGATAGTSASC
jgi:hypothetical protein